MALTDTRIRNLKAPQTGVAKYADGRGLTLLVTHTGTRTFYLRTRIDGRERMFRVGGYGEISLAEARRLAEEMRQRLQRGQPARVEDVPTLADVAGDWLNLRRSEITPAHAADIGRRLEKDVFPRLGNLPLPDITAPMILETLRPVSDRAPETAKRLRQYLSAIFRHGAACGIVTADPAAFVGQALRRPVKKHFPAIVDPTAFAGLMQSLRDYYGAPDVRRALLFLVATAVRPGNVRSATWEEIDLQARTWTIPGPKMKNRRQHVVPLNSVACAVLAEIERERPGKEGFLFPGRAGRPLSENTLNTALKSLGYAGKHTSHSFRSSLSSMANEAGIARPDVIVVIPGYAYCAIFKTARKWVFAAIIFSKASFACSRGKTSMSGRTFVNTLNFTAAFISRISVNVPFTVFAPIKKFMADQSSGASDTAAMMSSPFLQRPPIRGDMAFTEGAVAMIAFAPPRA